MGTHIVDLSMASYEAPVKLLKETMAKPREDEKTVKQSSWSLVQSEEYTDDIQEYRRRHRKAW